MQKVHSFVSVGSEVPPRSLVLLSGTGLFNIASAALAAIPVAVPAPAGSAASDQRNLVQTAAAAGQFKTLIKLAQAAGLAGALEGKGALTMFAPIDAKPPRPAVAALEHSRAKLRGARVINTNIVIDGVLIPR